MNDILKQRLVGALILVALGVVFWPIIFVQPEDKMTATQDFMPAPPGIPTTAIEAPDQGTLRGSPVLSDGPVAEDPVDVNEAVDTPQLELAPSSTEAEAEKKAETQPVTKPTSGNTRTEAPEQLVMDSDGLPVAWTLQVATVSSAEKAEKLRKRLLDMNQKAYVVTVSSGGKRLYRVSVGPKFERAEVEKLKTTIDAKFKVTSMVARYIP